MNNLEQLKEIFDEIEVPDELERFFENTIMRKGREMKRNRIIKTAAVTLAAAILVFAGTINIFPVAAGAMGQIPVVKNLVRLVNFKQMVYQDDTYKADIKVPQLKGLESGELEQALNKKYLEEGKALYDNFLNEIGAEELSPDFFALITNFKVKVNKENVFVVERIKTQIGASGAESVTYDNIDLKNQMIITLPSLFKDDSYIDAISSNVITQMQEKTNLEEGVMYFIGESEGGFVKINSDQTFYINADSKLVIVFDEYEVAPGCMGIVEFEIPTKIIQEMLVSNRYVK